MGRLWKIIGYTWLYYVMLYYTCGKTISKPDGLSSFPLWIRHNAWVFILMFRSISTAETAHFLSGLSCICPSGKRTCGPDAEALSGGYNPILWMEEIPHQLMVYRSKNHPFGSAGFLKNPQYVTRVLVLLNTRLKRVQIQIIQQDMHQKCIKMA